MVGHYWFVRFRIKWPLYIRLYITFKILLWPLLIYLSLCLLSVFLCWFLCYMFNLFSWTQRRVQSGIYIGLPCLTYAIIAALGALIQHVTLRVVRTGRALPKKKGGQYFFPYSTSAFNSVPIYILRALLQLHLYVHNSSIYPFRARWSASCSL